MSCQQYLTQLSKSNTPRRPTLAEPADKKARLYTGYGGEEAGQVHPGTENTRKSQPSISALPRVGGSPGQAARPPSTARLITPLPMANPKPSAPYIWPLFVSVCIQGVVTAAPKTVAFGAGTVIQSRQRSQPCGGGGGQAEQRGLKEVKGLPLSSVGPQLPAPPTSESPGNLRANSPVCLPIRRWHPSRGSGPEQKKTGST